MFANPGGSSSAAILASHRPAIALLYLFFSSRKGFSESLLSMVLNKCKNIGLFLNRCIPDVWGCPVIGTPKQLPFINKYWLMWSLGLWVRSWKSGVRWFLRRQAGTEAAWPYHHCDGLQRVEVRILPGEPDNTVRPKQVLCLQRVASPLVKEEVKDIRMRCESSLPEGRRVAPTL